MFDRAIDDARPRRRAGALLSFAAAVVATLASLALLLPALARAQTTFGSSGQGAGQLSNPRDVAVDQSSGNVYVADQGNRRVDVFASDGTFIKAFGWGVADGASQLETCTTATTCRQGLSGSGAGQFSTASAIAVDQSSGDVYVADVADTRVQKFDSSGSFLLMFGGGVDKTSGGNVCTAASGDVCGEGVAGYGSGQFARFNVMTALGVGADGTVYVGNNDGNGSAAVAEFDDSGVFVAQFTGALGNDSTGTPSANRLAVAPNGDVYVGRAFSKGNRIQKFSPAWSLLATPFSGASSSQFEVGAVTVDGLGDLFALESSGALRVLELDRTGAQVGSFPVASVTDSSGGIAYGASSRNVYVVDPSGDRVAVVPAAPPPGPYIAPGSESATGVGRTDATLRAILNPNGHAAGYHFEYGLTSAYGHSAGAGLLPGDTAFHHVSAGLPGLLPFTTYHFRVVVGGRAGPDRTFMTFAEHTVQSCPNQALRYGLGARLPDCRAYEQVSPVDKGHNDVLYRMAAVSPSGDAAAFGSYNAFAGSVSSGNAVGYMASRHADGWGTLALSPGIDTQVGAAQGNGWVLGMSSGFTQALVATYKAITPGATAGNINLYVRDARTGHVTFVATTANANFLQLVASFAGVSADGSRWVFSTRTNKMALASTPPPPSTALFKENLYEFSASGGLRLVGILPDGTVDPHGSVQAGATLTGTYAAEHPVSADAGRIYWTEPSFGAAPVYVREGNTTKAVSADTSGTARPARFRYATPDGKYAFLTSTTGLTADASASGTDLYRYDATTGDLADLTPGVTAAGGAGVEGVFGASDDGQFVYFMATGALAPGATAGDDNIYVWRQGDGIRFIGTLASKASDLTSKLLTGLGLQWWVSQDGSGFGFVFDGAVSGPDPQPAQPYSEAYYYSYADGRLVCASCLRNGAAPSGNVSYGLKGPGVLVPPANTAVFYGMSGTSLAVTNNGQIFFTSPDSLLPEDVNGRSDVYEYEREGSGSCVSARFNGGCVYLISTGKGNTDAVFTGASRSGRDAFFTTYESLVGQDQDNNNDLYDARIDGGLASQNPQHVAPCAAGSCKGPLASGLSTPSLGSVHFTGPGNVSRGAHAAAVFHVRPLSRRQRRRLARGRRIGLRVRVSQPGRVRAVIHARFRRRGHRGHVRRVARSSRRARHGGTVRLRLRLSGPARRYLRHPRRLRVAVRVRYSRVHGAQRARFTLRRARGRHRRRVRLRHRAASAHRRGGRR